MRPSWATDEHCLDPQAFIDYQALGAFIDTVDTSNSRHAFSLQYPFKLSSMTESDAALKLSWWLWDPKGDDAFFIAETRRLLEAALPALIQLRDAGDYQLTIVNLPSLLTRDSLEVVSRHPRIGDEKREQLANFLRLTAHSDISMVGSAPDGLGYASLHLQPLYSYWRGQVRAYFFKIASQCVFQAGRYSRITRCKAYAEFAALTDHICGLSESILADGLAWAGAAPYEYLPHFGLQTRGSSFADDLGL